MSSLFFKIYTMHPVTERQIQNKLKQISESAGIQVSSDILKGIIMSSSRDARNSILTLGMYLIKEKAEREIGKRRKITKEEAEQDVSIYSKDTSIGIYHTVGKFLYNKRRRRRNWVGADPEEKGKPRQFGEEVMNSPMRPKMYFVPEEAIDRCGDTYEKFKEYVLNSALVCYSRTCSTLPMT